MGSPLLRTERTASPVAARSVTATVPPGSVYLQALSKSTATARWRRAALPRYGAMPGATVHCQVRSRSKATASKVRASPFTRRLRSTTAAGPSEVWAPWGRSGQIEHIGHEALHALRLHLGALNPLALAGDGVTAALPQDGVVGEDDRERGLQFVGRVGYELLLLGPGLLNRAQRPAGEDEIQKEQQPQRP